LFVPYESEPEIILQITAIYVVFISKRKNSNHKFLNRKFFNTTRRIKIEMMAIANYCVGCAFCMFVCPEGAIRVVGNAEIDSEKCSECKRCMRYCPVEAIRYVE